MEIQNPPVADVSVIFLRGLACVDRGDFALAREAFDQALRLAPDKPNLWWNRAQCSLALGEMSRVQADAEQLLRISPEHAQGNALLGKALLAKGSIEAGVGRMVRAWQLDSLNPDFAADALDATLLLEGHEDQALDLALNMAALQRLSPEMGQRLVGMLLLKPGGEDFAHRLWLGLMDLPQPQEWMFKGWVEHCLSMNSLEEAALACSRWLQVAPNQAEPQLQLAAVFSAKGDFSAALPLLHAYIQSEQGHEDVAAWCRMVRALYESRAHEQEAWLLCQSAIERFPDSAEVWRERGHLFLCMGESDLALADFERALALNTADTSALCNLAIGLAQKGMFAQAMHRLDHVLASQNVQNDLEVINTRGILLHSMGRFAEVEALYRSVLAVSSQPRIAVNLAFTLLVQGQYEEGFSLLAQRDRVAWAQQRFYKALSLGARPWDGRLEVARGKRLLVLSQNGIGDTVQFARYLPWLQNQGVQIILQAPARTENLLHSMHPEVIVIGDKQDLPATDWVADVHSLPGLLGITLDTIDAKGPAHYLQVNADDKRRMHMALGPARGLRVAVCWRGTRSSWAERSIPLDFLANLGITGVEWFSLQYGPLLSDDLAAVSRMGMRHESWSFSDVAAAMACMDLVVSIDTVHAHISGSLGLPTLVLLNAVPEWRWGLEGITSHWYSTATLLRQEVYGEWDKPLAALACHIQGLKETRRIGAPPTTVEELQAWACELELEHPERWAGPARWRAEQLAHQNDAAQALIYAQLAVSFDEKDPANWTCAGQQLLASGRFEDARKAFAQALFLNPRDVQAQLGRAHVQVRQLKLQEALTTASQAAEDARSSGHEWDKVSTCQTKAMVLRALHRVAEADQVLRAGMAKHPHHELAQSLGQLCLLRGDDAEGWHWLNQRERHLEFAPHTQAACERGARLWREPGVGPLLGKRLLVTTENGHGDSFQFCRFLPWLVSQGVQVTLLSQQATLGVLRRLEPAVQVLPDSLTWTQGVPQVDWVCDAQWLPALLEVSRQQLDDYGPADYLQNSAADLAHMQAVLPSYGRLRVGLAWRGQAVGLVNRGLALNLIARADCGPVDWYSLQTGALTPEETSAAQEMGMKTPNWTFQDAAAAMGVLDCIVSVDTAHAHLAGSLGRPCCVLLNATPDWRWGLEGERSVWYPSLKLLRQSQPGDWGPVIAQLEQALHQQRSHMSMAAIHHR